MPRTPHFFTVNEAVLYADEANLGYTNLCMILKIVVVNTGVLLNDIDEGDTLNVALGENIWRNIGRYDLS